MTERNSAQFVSRSHLTQKQNSRNPLTGVSVQGPWSICDGFECLAELNPWVNDSYSNVSSVLNAGQVTIATRGGPYTAFSSSSSLGTRKRRGPHLEVLRHRKMLAFCCQKQFSLTLDNMRQYSNTAQWMAADVTKPQVSKKNRQQTNLKAFWTRALTDNPLAARATPRKPQIESFASHLLGTFAAPWHADRISLQWQSPRQVIDLLDV